MDPGALRNFKDFLQLYNRMTEMCFYRCVDNMNTRHLSDNEIDCVEDCSSKFVKFNNKLMQNFVSAQTEIVNKRVADAEKQQLEQAETEQLAESKLQLTSQEDTQLKDGNKAVAQQNELKNIVVKS